LENVVYYGLKDSWTIGYTKKHYQRLKKTVVGMECSFPLISGLDSDIVKTPVDIQFYKVSYFLEL